MLAASMVAVRSKTASNVCVFVTLHSPVHAWNVLLFNNLTFLFSNNLFIVNLDTLFNRIRPFNRLRIVTELSLCLSICCFLSHHSKKDRGFISLSIFTNHCGALVKAKTTPHVEHHIEHPNLLFVKLWLLLFKDYALVHVVLIVCFFDYVLEQGQLWACL